MILKSINYWSFPGGLDGTLPVKDFFQQAKDNGFSAVELAIGEPGSALGTDATKEDCFKIVELAKTIGVELPSVASGLYWGRNLADAEASNRKAAKEDLERMLRITSWLGAKTLLTIPGAVDVFFLPDRPKLTYEHVWTHATEGLKSVLPVAEEVQVRIGIENVWNKFLMSPQEMSMFLDQFDSPMIGSYFDVGNVLAFGFPEDWIHHLGSSIVGVHFKDFRVNVGTIDGFVDLLEGDVHWPDVMAALRAINYDGPVVAEMIPGYKFHPMVRIGNTSRAMDAILR